MSKKKPKDTTGYISFHIKVHMAGADVVNIKDTIKMPFLTDPSHLPTSEVNFKNMFHSMITGPAETRVVMALRALLEEERQMRLQGDNQDLEGNFTPQDVFLDNKMEVEADDKKEKGSDDNTSEEGEQGDTEEELEETEGTTPSTISSSSSSSL